METRKVDEVIEKVVREQLDQRVASGNDLFLALFGSVEEAIRERKNSDVPLTMVRPAPLSAIPMPTGEPSIRHHPDYLAIVVQCPVHRCESVGPPITSRAELEAQTAAYARGELIGQCCL